MQGEYIARARQIDLPSLRIQRSGAESCACNNFEWDVSALGAADDPMPLPLRRWLLRK